MGTGVRAAVTSGIGLVVVGLLLFVPAGTFAYWQGWAFIGVFVATTAIFTAYLLSTNPAALERRMRAGQETRPRQRILVGAFFLLLPGMLVFSALDQRLGWSPVPVGVSVLGLVLVVVGLGIAMAVTVQNGYAAGNIAVEGDQQTITTGLYGVVRHPMYTGSLIMMAGMPLALGSWWGLAFVVLVAIILVFRIRDEESMLEQHLAGYREYEQATRFRLIPYAW